jgi:hypothetical protein
MYNGGMIAIIWIYTPEGFVVGADGRRKNIPSVSPNSVPLTPRFMRKGSFTSDCHVFNGNRDGPVVVVNVRQPIHLGGLITGTNPPLEFESVTPGSDVREVLDKAVDCTNKHERLVFGRSR